MTVEPHSINRQQAVVDDLGSLQENFVIKARDYKMQYAHLYYMRLMLMRPTVLAKATQKWGS